MAFWDALDTFVSPFAPLSLVGAVGVGIPSNVIDLLGLGVGVAPTNDIIGNATVFGQPAGMGLGRRAELFCAIGTALATANAGTLNTQFQAAADPGAAGNYTPAAAAWQTVLETGYLTAAQLAAGAIFARFPWVPPFPANLKPRFLRLMFQPLAATNFSAGTVAFATSVLDRNDSFNKYAVANYKVQ